MVCVASVFVTFVFLLFFFACRWMFGRNSVSPTSSVLTGVVLKQAPCLFTVESINCYRFNNGLLISELPPSGNP